MILVWRGWGIVVVGIAVLWLGVAIVLGEAIHADKAGGAAIFGLCLVPAGAMTWFVGRRMNRDATRILLDPATGEQVVVRRDHSLFFVPVEWWGPILAVLGIGLFLIEALAPVR
jgi:hypothetical protein